MQQKSQQASLTTYEIRSILLAKISKTAIRDKESNSTRQHVGLNLLTA